MKLYQQQARINLKRYGSLLIGPVLVVMLSALFAYLSRNGFMVPAPSAIFLLVVAFASFQGGLASGLLSAMLALLYYAFELSTPDGLLTLSEFDLQRTLVLGLSSPAMALMIHQLKSRAERANYNLLRQTQQYTVSLEVAIGQSRRAEEQVQALNRELEQRVAERTHQLELSRSRISAILESITDNLFGVDRQWRFTFLNQPAAALANMPADQLIGRSFFEIFPHLRDDKIYDVGRQVLETGTAQVFEEYYPNASRWFEVSIFPSQVGLSIYSRDVTRRKNTEEEVRQWANIFKYSNQAVLALNPQTRQIQLANPGLSLITGYSAEELIGKHATELYHPDYLKAANEMIAKNFQSPIFTFESVYRRKDGSPLPVFIQISSVMGEDGLVRYRVANVSDISELKQTEQKLLSSEARFRLLVEGIRDYAIFMLDGTGRVSSWNSGAERLNGYSEEEATGQPLSLFYSPGDVAAGKPEHELQLALANGQYEVEDWRVRKNGSTFWANVLITALYDRQNQGLLQGFAMLVRDATERRNLLLEIEQRAEELELRVRERTRELEEANRHKSQFLSQMSHELRTPLNSILGFTGLLLQQLPGPLNEEQTRQMEMVRGSARQLLALISGLLDLARIEAGRVELKITDFHPAEVLRSVLESVRPLAESKNLTVSLQLGVGLPESIVRNDELKFKQIILNLLSNAIKYTDRGTISLNARLISPAAVPGPARDQAGNRPDRGTGGLSWPGLVATPWLEVGVQDTGIGISPELLPRLFEEFGQLEEAGTRRQGGAGLGLALTRRLVELLQGRIRVSSIRGEGTIFTVELPLVRS